MLFIEALQLSLYRSHARLELAFDARPVAIYGPNGAGKTNLIEAISLLSPGRGMRRAKLTEISKQPEALGFKINAGLVRGDERHEITTSSEGGTARGVRINDKPASQTALGSLLSVVWLVPAMDRLWTDTAETRRRFLDRMTLSFFPEHASASIGYEKAMRERNRLLKDGVSDAHWYRALEARMGEAGAQIMALRAEALAHVKKAQEGGVAEFPIAQMHIETGDTPAALTASELQTALADHRSRDLAAGRTLLGPHRADLSAVMGGTTMPAAQCSTGEQKAMLISTVLANARALQQRDQHPPILLLDEVSAHLDEGRRAALYNEILASGIQAFMTGTEHHLFAELGETAQAVVISNDGRVTQSAAL